VSISVKEPEETVIIEADATQLTKVFYNVIENSMKYMGRSGEIKITISRSGGDVLIVFSDNGKGLNEEELNKIFDLSYQGSNSKQGSGMGLHLAKLSVSAHGGEIYAKSSVNQGMKIFICLPNEAFKSDKLVKCKTLSNL
jgi:signal transduction histidine kinase